MAGSGGCGARRGGRLDEDRRVIGSVAGDHEADSQRDRADDRNDEDPQRIEAADKRHRDDHEHRDSDGGGSDRDEMKSDPLCDVPSVQRSQRVLRANPRVVFGAMPWLLARALKNHAPAQPTMRSNLFNAV